MKKIIFGLVLVLGLTLVGFKAYSYYQDTYVGQDYYVRVPENVERSLETWRSGNYTITGRRYTFEGFNTHGQARELEIHITDDQGPITIDDLLQPGQYIRINASARRVINYTLIDENQVPEGILQYLN